MFGQSLQEQFQQSGSKLPAIVADCLRWIAANGLLQPDIFNSNLDADTIAVVCNAYDTKNAKPLQEVTDARLVAAVLQHWIRSLPEPLISIRLQAKLMESCKVVLDVNAQLTKFQHILAEAEKHVICTLRPMLLILQQYMLRQQQSETQLKKLARVFAELLFPSIHAAGGKGVPARALEVMSFCIKNALKIFTGFPTSCPTSPGSSFCSSDVAGGSPSHSRINVGLEGAQSSTQYEDECSILDSYEEEVIREPMFTKVLDKLVAGVVSDWGCPEDETFDHDPCTLEFTGSLHNGMELPFDGVAVVCVVKACGISTQKKHLSIGHVLSKDAGDALHALSSEHHMKKQQGHSSRSELELQAIASQLGEGPPVSEMSLASIVEEKRVLKQKLRNLADAYEAYSGNSVVKEEEEVMRPVYVRYHKLNHAIKKSKVSIPGLHAGSVTLGLGCISPRSTVQSVGA